MKSKIILIAYQDDLWVRSLATYFHGQGYRVEIVKALSEMIKKVRNGQHQVILLDDEIEGLKACDVVSLLKKVNSKIQVIMISSEESLRGVKKAAKICGFFLPSNPSPTFPNHFRESQALRHGRIFKKQRL